MKLQGAGAMRRRLTIQVPDDTKNVYGERTNPDAWFTEGTVWGRVEELGGQELFYARQVWPESQYRVTIKWQPGMTSRKRLILDDGRVLNIGNVSNKDERKIELTLLCAEKSL